VKGGLPKSAGRAGPDDDALGKAYDTRLMRRLWAYIRPHPTLVFGSLALLPLVTLLGLSQPWLFKLAIDGHITPRRMTGLGWIALLFVAAMVAEHAIRFAQLFVMQMLGQRAMYDLRRDLYRHLLSRRAAFFDRQPVGRLMTRVLGDVESINEAFAAGLITIVGDLVTLLGIVFAMFLLDARLALLALCTSPALFGVAWLFRGYIRTAFREIRTRVARLNAFSQEHISGMKVVQLFAREAEARAEFDALNLSHRDANTLGIRYDAMLYAIVEALGSIGVAGLLWYGGGRIVRGALTFGVLVAFIEYLQRFYTPIRDLSTKYTIMQQAMASAERIFSLMDVDEPDAPLASPSEATSAAADDAAPLVEMKNVSFSYREGEPVLHDMSLRVRRGQTVALVGATGSGKSTVIKLLARLYEADAGDLRVAGRDLRTIPAAEVRRRITVVPQDVFLFSGTVRDNVALWQELPAGAVETAARRVGLDRALLRRGRTLEDPVLERGANFSAGEKQLVAFARALARDPELLVLDEATASVDPETERLIEDGLGELMRARTTIVIAHRLSTIERADTIVVLHKGRIVESGTHANLLRQAGVYARLYRLQYSGPAAAAGASGG
jgi:ATP-binding cassette, subfamily B, multidrug efflux pump